MASCISVMFRREAKPIRHPAICCTYHFTVWFVNDEWNMVSLLVQRDAAGHLVIEPLDYNGGNAPHGVRPIPPEAAELPPEPLVGRSVA